MQFATYETANFYDEMFLADGSPRSGARLLQERIASLPDGELLARQAAAERLLLQNGITFNVYSDSAATEKIFPFDIIPRIVSAFERSGRRCQPQGPTPTIEARGASIDSCERDASRPFAPVIHHRRTASFAPKLSGYAWRRVFSQASTSAE